MPDQTVNTSGLTIFDNKILWITIIVWAITQTIKVILGVIREKRFNFRWFIGTGGMPSSHAAGACALATCCGLEMGFHSVIFALAMVFAFVTMFDAQGVRRSAGEQASILNQIVDDMYAHHQFKPEKLIELIGHSPFQVFVGGVLGMALAVIFYQMM